MGRVYVCTDEMGQCMEACKTTLVACKGYVDIPCENPMKPLFMFSHSASSKNGHMPVCKVCDNSEARKIQKQTPGLITRHAEKHDGEVCWCSKHDFRFAEFLMNPKPQVGWTWGEWESALKERSRLITSMNLKRGK